MSTPTRRTRASRKRMRDDDQRVPGETHDDKPGSTLMKNLEECGKMWYVPDTACGLCQIKHNNMPACQKCKQPLCHQCIGIMDPEPRTRVRDTGYTDVASKHECPFCRYESKEPQGWAARPCGDGDPRIITFRCKHEGCNYKIHFAKAFHADRGTFILSTENKNASDGVMVDHHRSCPHQPMSGTLYDNLQEDTKVGFILKSWRRMCRYKTLEIEELQEMLEEERQNQVDVGF